MSPTVPGYCGRLLYTGEPDNPIRIEVADLSPLSVLELEALERFAQARLTIIDAEPQPD
jgi:hypothetical protein